MVRVTCQVKDFGSSSPSPTSPNQLVEQPGSPCGIPIDYLAQSTQMASGRRRRPAAGVTCVRGIAESSGFATRRYALGPLL